MSSYHEAWLRHQQSRWLRPDAARWVRPDAARFLAPGADIAKAFPALARKYNPDQPRVPTGNPDGGQWTDGNAGGGNLGLFQITPCDNTIDGVQLAGDSQPGMGHNQGPPLDEPPEIPPAPRKPGERSIDFIRRVVKYLRVVGPMSPAADATFEALRQAEGLRGETAAIKSANDPPRTLEELQARARLPSEPGYEDHHIVGQFAQNRLQFGDDMIYSPENEVRIPVVKHLDINRYYSTPNVRFDGLSPRDYLRGKNWDDQMREGLTILRDNGVLR
jgi:hypothetical protein